MADTTELFALARSIDAERAQRVEAALGRHLDPASAALAVGVALVTAYPALQSAVEAEAGFVATLAQDGFGAARDRATMLRTLSLAAGETADLAFMQGLRRGARRERLRIALRELVPGSLGGADVDVTARELAIFAEATIELTLGFARRAVEDRCGSPRASNGSPARFVVLGMGKLGGGELNPGSDVDLIYLYDTDEGEAVNSQGTRTSLHEFWIRVARRLTAALDEMTEDGMLWRVDLRLRPEGGSGALVNSMAAAERYYESFGRLWERAALLRARPVAGELRFGEEALAILAPFVWRRRVDPSIATEMRALVERSRSELSVDASRDLKLGEGGIREAEFFVQTLQLIWGGIEPRTRVRGTLDALRRLRARGLVTDREGREIAEGYLALRRAEHAIQTGSGLQTHLTPRAPEELRRLAHSLGFADETALAADLAQHRSRIAARFLALVPEKARRASRWGLVVAALDRGDPEALAEALGAELDAAVAQGALARDVFELSRHPDGLLGARSRDLHPSLAENVLDAIADAADPEQAARFVRMLFHRLRRPAVYMGLLGADPSAVHRLIEALGISAFIGQAVASNPELGDLVLFSRPVPTPELAREEVRVAVRAPRSDEEPEEALVGALRQAKSRIVLEVALADLSGELTTRQATQVLSALADAQLEAATRFSLGTAEDEPVRGFAVMAMGKLGGCELGYGSDLDLVFLYDPSSLPPAVDAIATFTKVARRIIRLITISHPAGVGYELDTRLRPSGNQGLLVTSLAAFTRYHQQDAAVDGVEPRVKAAIWERMALLRARIAAGDADLGAQAIRVAHRTAYGAVDDPRAVAAEVHRLRTRMENELSHERPGRHDLKMGRGGLTELEFVVQLLSMLFGQELLVRSTETLVALDALAAIGALSAEHAEGLGEGYRFLRRLEQRLRIVHADASRLIEEKAPGLLPLARRMGIRDRPRAEAGAELLARYREVTSRVRVVYEAEVVARAESASGERGPSG
jgi:glutamate-ammonia-ligase adenylyltransferase